MCKARNVTDDPFGGINMIVAGDFAQLPPIATGDALYSSGPVSTPHTTTSVEQQKSSIGHAVWHQFTTVVILKQNMRQKSQSVNDGKFRQCLERMRYGTCTEADIRLLRARIVGKGPGQPKLSDPNFHHVSIITSWNAYRDKSMS